MNTSTNKKRVYFFDSMRAILILLIVAIHTLQVFNPNASWLIHHPNDIAIAPFIIDFLLLFTLQSFFIMSGYLAAMSINKLGAKNLTDDEALQLIQTHLKESWWGIYLEAGSGVDHAASIAQRLELVKRTKTTFPNKILLTGGGIVSPKQIRNLKESGADIIVVSTVLEKSDNPYDLITEFIEVLIEP